MLAARRQFLLTTKQCVEKVREAEVCGGRGPEMAEQVEMDLDVDKEDDDVDECVAVVSRVTTEAD
jgi:hypothetical protein